MVECVECLNWQPRETDPKIARHGFSVCKVKSKSKAEMYSGLYPHECDHFHQAPDEVVKARRYYIERMRNQCSETT